MSMNVKEEKPNNDYLILGGNRYLILSKILAYLKLGGIIYLKSDIH